MGKCLIKELTKIRFFPNFIRNQKWIKVKMDSMRLEKYLQ